MFSNIKLTEAAIFAEIMTNGFSDEKGKFYKPTPKTKIVDEIQLIDNMLTVLKTKSLLNKKRGVKRMLDGLLGIATGDQSILIGAANNQLMK